MRTLAGVALVLAVPLASHPGHAGTSEWQPPAGYHQEAIWPDAAPDAPAVPGPETVTVGTALLAGRTVTAVTNVTRPTLSVLRPKVDNTGAAVIVVPGGGFEGLAIDLEGTEACDWLTVNGITCVVLKYRVPSAPYVWKCDCRPHNLAISVPALQDLQRTMRLVRANAARWQIDPHRIGVLGFSAGGFLVTEISSLYDRPLYRPVDAADQQSARPDFAMPIYPGHLTAPGGRFNPAIPLTARTSPTFLVQAEDDDVDGVKQALTYYTALIKAKVPAEMHLYAKGGHAFGLRHTTRPITDWPRLALIWLRTEGIVRD